MQLDFAPLHVCAIFDFPHVCKHTAVVYGRKSKTGARINGKENVLHMRHKKLRSELCH